MLALFVKCLLGQKEKGTGFISPPVNILKLLFAVKLLSHYFAFSFVISGVRKMLDDLGKVMKNFESRAEFTEDLQKMSDVRNIFFRAQGAF